MGASTREIDRQTNETRERVDGNINAPEGRSASSAVRYGRIVAVVVAALAIGGAGFVIYRRMHRPTLKDRLDSLSIESLRELAVEVSGRLKERLPSVTLGTASTALLERVARPWRAEHATQQTG